MVAIYINKTNSQVPPPAYVGNNQAVPMETKPGGTYTYQQSSVAPTPQPAPAQPAFVPQNVHNPGYPSYAQDPVNREATVSPMTSQAPSYPGNASELSSPQHTGYNPNASELGAK
jgi:hypothetical protein